MYNILILAANGMAGHVISSKLEQNKNFNILKTSRDERLNTRQNIVNLDLKNFDKLNQLIERFKPSYVINCAGILVKASSEDPCEAILINSYLPNYLDKLSKLNNFKLIHISTDCVFSGKKGQYIESDNTDAQDSYGRTKALGEINNTHNLTIRTSIIGPELKNNGTGLLHWFLNQSGTIKGFTNAIWSGVTTLELAKFINSIIKNELGKPDQSKKSISGLFHLTNNKKINKYQLLDVFKNIFKTEHITIHPDDVYHVDKSLVNTRTEINTYLDYNIPDYDIMLHELYQYMTYHKALYKQYKIFE